MSFHWIFPSIMFKCQHHVIYYVFLKNVANEIYKTKAQKSTQTIKLNIIVTNVVNNFYSEFNVSMICFNELC